MEPLATTAEVAEYLRVKPNTLDHWASNGKGPIYIKFEGTRRYRWSDVEAYLNDRQVRP